MDKIGFEGVEKELLESGYAQDSVSQYMELLRNVTKDADGVRRLGEQLADVLPSEVSENLAHIMDTVLSLIHIFGPDCDLHTGQTVRTAG